jgi:chemotaxis protein CheD
VTTPAPPDVLEIFLQPGEFYFGEELTRIRTMLGSCIAIALWHPRLHIGGMCHYMLPHRPQRREGESIDGRYADEAMQLFICELRRSRTHPGEYRAKLFGGGAMLDASGPRGQHADIPGRNMAAAVQLLALHGFEVHAQDIGGRGHRNVILDLWTGAVWLKRVPRPAARTA